MNLRNMCVYIYLYEYGHICLSSTKLDDQRLIRVKKGWGWKITRENRVLISLNVLLGASMASMASTP